MSDIVIELYSCRIVNQKELFKIRFFFKELSSFEAFVNIRHFTVTFSISVIFDQF